MCTLESYVKVNGEYMLWSSCQVKDVDEAGDMLNVMFTDVYVYWIGLRDSMKYIVKPA